jgi:hypothetical protein
MSENLHAEYGQIMLSKVYKCEPISRASQPPVSVVRRQTAFAPSAACVEVAVNQRFVPISRQLLSVIASDLRSATGVYVALEDCSLAVGALFSAMESCGQLSLRQ